MQEFSAISVSTYDPDALVGQLNDKAADGWDVVSIVPTGSTITAYLSRESTGDASAAAVVPEPAAEPSPAPEPSPADEPTGEPGLPETGAIAAAAVAAQPEPAAEPAPADEPTGEPGLPEMGAVGTAAAAEPAAEPAAAEPAAAEPAAEPAAAAQPAAANAAPAGWYADPSGRFELRYWDGGTWTEHVSRAGQQYTDPPVA